MAVAKNLNIRLMQRINANRLLVVFSIAVIAKFSCVSDKLIGAKTNEEF
jgi:hypothetical protein